MTSSGDSTSVGGRYREFEILEEIGAGSFAHVYRVRAPGHKKPLALKLATARMTPDTIKRAVREVAILRTLSNPHVVRLHGSSIGSDHFYLLMDYLQGRQLDQHHDFTTSMGLAEALGIIQQVCMGLAEAHAKGVVHRDIKPANIWIEPEGTVKLLDFGLARAWNVPWAFGANATAARTLVGTPHYCQPEQLHSDQLTPASDVYSLGMVLYELLCGRTALFPDRPVPDVVGEMRENPVGWLDAHVNRPVVPITRYPGCAGLPSRVLEVLDVALAKDPAARIPDAGRLGSILGDVLCEDLEAVRPGTVKVEVPGRPVLALPLVPGRRILGSAADADFVVDAPDVSAQHLILDWSGTPRPVHVRAAGAGPLVREADGARRLVSEAIAVAPGDRLAFGRCALTIVYP